MPFVYDKLWNLLKERKMSKEELRLLIEAAPNTIAKMGRNEPISLTLLDRICQALSVTPSEVMEYIPRTCHYKVGDTFQTVGLMTYEERENEIKRLRILLYRFINSKEELEVQCKELLESYTSVIVSIENNSVCYLPILEIPVSLDDSICLEESDLIVEKCEMIKYLNFDLIKKISMGEFVGKDIQVLETLSKDMVKKIKEKYSAYILDI